MAILLSQIPKLLDYPLLPLWSPLPFHSITELYNETKTKRQSGPQGKTGELSSSFFVIGSVIPGELGPEILRLHPQALVMGTLHCAQLPKANRFKLAECGSPRF